MTFKKKWDNYWYHYKWHTLGLIFFILLAAVLIHSCAAKKEPDLYAVYLSDSYMLDKDIEKLKTDFIKNGAVGDVDGDGEKVMVFEHLVSDFQVDGFTDESTAQKMQTVMHGDEHTLMLMHKFALEDYDGHFEDISDKVKDGDEVFKSPSEKFVTGISLKGNKLLESYGMDTENLYVAIRRRTEKEKEAGKDKEYFDQAYKTMEYILSHQR